MQAEFDAVLVAGHPNRRATRGVESVERVLAGVELNVDEPDAVSSRELDALFESDLAAEIDADAIAQVHGPRSPQHGAALATVVKRAPLKMVEQRKGMKPAQRLSARSLLWRLLQSCNAIGPDPSDAAGIQALGNCAMRIDAWLRNADTSAPLVASSSPS